MARASLETGQRVYDLVLARGWLSRAQLDELLRPEVLTRPHAPLVPTRRAGG